MRRDNTNSNIMTVIIKSGIIVVFVQFIFYHIVKWPPHNQKAVPLGMAFSKDYKTKTTKHFSVDQFLKPQSYSLDQ